MRKIIESILLRLFFKRNARQVMQERRLSYLFVQLYSCTTYDHLLMLHANMDKVLMPHDYAHPKFKELMREIEMVEAYIANDEPRMQQLRIDYGDYILRQNGIK